MATFATESSESSSSAWSNNNNTTTAAAQGDGSQSTSSTTQQQQQQQQESTPTGNKDTAPKVHMQLGRKRKRKTPNVAALATLSGSSSSSSSSSDEDDAPTKSASTTTSDSIHKTTMQAQQQPEGWRVKLYRLNADGSWDDCGTGRIVCLYKASFVHSSPHLHHEDALLYQELGEPTLIMNAESSTVENHVVLLRTRILLRDAYQRQGDNIITWCEPYFEHKDNNNNSGGGGGVDLALSFQDNAGCLDIWRQITNVQSRAAEWFRARGVMLHHDATKHDASKQPQHLMRTSQQPQTSQHNFHTTQNDSSVTDMAHAVAAAAHHSALQRQHHHHHHHHAQHVIWGNEQQQQQQGNAGMDASQQEEHYRDANAADAVAVSMAAAAAAAYGGHAVSKDLPENAPAAPNLPNPPTLANLEEIADTMAAAQLQLRDALAMFISQGECAYLKALLKLFPSAEAKGDYGALATLAACIKTVLLLNDPSIIELIVSDNVIFENVCSALEYDPDLRDKANHRWFIRKRAKFRTVVPMDNADLVGTIHRSFRVTYLRDTLLRPTMDEGSLSTLTSLQTFTHADLVKGVTCCPVSPEHGVFSLEQQEETVSSLPSLNQDEKEETSSDSYLVQIMRVLGKEVQAIARMEWDELETRASTMTSASSSQNEQQLFLLEPPTSPVSALNDEEKNGVPTKANKNDSASWKQHLAPQDGSLASRKIRRRGCLSFLRELFNIVRISLQQNDKDDFFAAIVSMEVDLEDKPERKAENQTQESEKVEGTQSDAPKEESKQTDQETETNKSSQQQEEESEKYGNGEHPVYLLALLATVLSDPTVDVTEKGAVLEIISAIAMHDPSHVRRHCLDLQEFQKSAKGGTFTATVGPTKPAPNERRQVMFCGPPDDLILALLFVLATETDAGLLLQTTEIMRFILDTDLLGEQGPMGVGLGGDENNNEGGVVAPGHHNASLEQQQQHQQENNHSHVLGNSGPIAGSDQNQFLSMFYEHYVYWLVAPFQFTILHPIRIVPSKVVASPSSSPLMTKIQSAFMSGSGSTTSKDQQQMMTLYLKLVPPCAIRSSFAVELLNFCVRAHLFRMKFFLLRTRVLGNVLKVLTPTTTESVSSGDRCLKLAAIRFLRAILSAKDEFYHRHIIQNNLFAPVFEAYRANPVGDNLVSSAIIEMCDYIHTQNIKSLIEYIVSKHLVPSTTSSPSSPKSSAEPSLEDVSTPYVNTLTILRQSYEETLQAATRKVSESNEDDGTTSRYFPPSIRPRSMSEKAMEDQRKFRQADEEESYFDADDDEESARPQRPEVGIDEYFEGSVELHRTPRMFSLAQAPLLSNAATDASTNSSVSFDAQGGEQRENDAREEGSTETTTL